MSFEKRLSTNILSFALGHCLDNKLSRVGGAESWTGIPLAPVSPGGHSKTSTSRGHIISLVLLAMHLQRVNNAFIHQDLKNPGNSRSGNIPNTRRDRYFITVQYAALRINYLSY